MLPFLSFPREIRDMIYDLVDDTKPMFMVLPETHPRLFVSRSSQSLLLATTQIHTEHRERLLRRASTVMCFAIASSSRWSLGIPAYLVNRLTEATIIIDLNSVEPCNEGTTLEEQNNYDFERLAQYIEQSLKAYVRLETINILWWVDLSLVRHIEATTRWIRALVASGTIRSQELWFGYLGRALHKPNHLRQHLVSAHNLQRQVERRDIQRADANLLPQVRVAIIEGQVSANKAIPVII